jgi:hypothetical protein
MTALPIGDCQLPIGRCLEFSLKFKTLAADQSAIFRSSLSANRQSEIDNRQ